MIKKIQFKIGVFIIFRLSNCNQEATVEVIEQKDWQSFFDDENVIGTTVVYDLKNEKKWVYNLERTETGYLPASTFKIINSMIGLETGAIALNDTIKWNGEEVWNDAWKNDHVLKSAFAVSCVPCYQQIARKVGVEQMINYTNKSNYGKMVIDSSTIDDFWLVGDSKITAFEQVDFLSKLFKETLPFSKQTMNSIKDIMINEENDEYILRAKTGWSQSDSLNNGWFVGYLTTLDKAENATFLFATNIERARNVDSKGFGDARKSITMNILKDLK